MQILNQFLRIDDDDDALFCGIVDRRKSFTPCL